MRPSPWKRRLVTTVRWSLLVDALVSALAALLTTFPWPVWTQAMGTEAWPVGFVVPEIALWLVPLPVCFAAAALWLGRRGAVGSPGSRSRCAQAAVILLCKPAVQAWRLGRTLDATLDAAFGAPPVVPPCPPFSLAATVVPRNPAPLAIETMQYADGLLLDFYRPPGTAAGHSPRPCVVVIHGGSWVHGNRLDDGTKRWLNDWLAGLGYAVASIDYRLSPQFKWPAQRDDLLAAVRFLREHAAALGIDPDRLVLVGRSAGAQMATAAAYAEVIPGVRGIVDIYGPTDFDLTWDAATRTAEPRPPLQPRNIPRRQRGDGARRLPERERRHARHPARTADPDPPRRAGHQRVPGAGGAPGPEPRRGRRAARAGVAAVGRPRVRLGPLRHARRRSEGMRSCDFLASVTR